MMKYLLLSCCSRYNGSTLLKSTKEVFNMQEAWHCPNMFLAVVHHHAFHIITQREGPPLSTTRGHFE